jgi:glycosyltransferase involved in cell wall biosynthesis
MSFSKKHTNLDLKNFKLSIVIATVGEETLKKLIKQIKSSTFIPNEIIVVFPEVDMVEKIFLKSKDTLIFRSPKSGQVAQRCYGISKAKNKYILQLDADIEIKKDTIEQLIKSYIINGPKIVVGPKFDYLNKKKINKKNKYRAWKFIFQIFGGGNINVFDLNKPFRYDSWFYDYKQPKKSGHTNVLPGGCILFNKDYYKNFDFYPLKGKALGEDLINSVYFQSFGCKLFFEVKSTIYLSEEGVYVYKNIYNLIIDLIKIYKIKRFVCILAKGNLYRFHLWFCYYILLSLLKHTLIHKKA